MHAAALFGASVFGFVWPLAPRTYQSCDTIVCVSYDRIDASLGWCVMYVYYTLLHVCVVEE